ncbi:MAG: thiamine-phosphate kinase [Candidatus Acidiferrum sp.]
MSGQENELIQRISALLGGRRRSNGSVALGIGDDAALWVPTPGKEVVLTCDWFLEGTHFLGGKHPADAVGWKCLARAVSDIAAMGGEPRCFLMSLALPADLTGRWLDHFLRGLRRAAKELHCEAAGGDTTRRKEVLISITVIGEVSRGEAILRSGAEVGDAIYVSGTLGEAELGLRMLRRGRGVAKATNAALRKHLYPRPRLELGRWLAEEGLASAMMDLSDGLSTDLPRLCVASKVGARIEVDSLPVSSLVERGEAKKLALHGGDDYELLFTVKRKNERRLPRKFRGLRLTRIGEITGERRIMVADDGRRVGLRSGGWDPFR